MHTSLRQLRRWDSRRLSSWLATWATLSLDGSQIAWLRLGHSHQRCVCVSILPYLFLHYGLVCRLIKTSTDEHLNFNIQCVVLTTAAALSAFQFFYVVSDCADFFVPCGYSRPNHPQISINYVWMYPISWGSLLGHHGVDLGVG